MSAELKIGSIILLRNTAPGGGYLDTYGWVANKPEFWNVAGSERIFVSTYAQPDRGGGTTSWQIVSADGKHDGDPLKIGDRVHLRNMYPDAGYLDCCGWVEDLGPFRAPELGYLGNVHCGVFTSGAPNRDNGTGIWQIQALDTSAGAVYAGAEIVLENSYPANGHPPDSQHTAAGALVAYGAAAEPAAFKEFQDRQLLVFTSTNAEIKRKHGVWQVSLSPAYAQARADTSLFDFFRPELLKGRSHAMESVSATTTVLLLDAFQGICAIDLEQATQAGDAPASDDKKRLDALLTETSEATNPPNVIGYQFQVKQLWNLFMLSKLLKRFDQSTLQALMQQVLTASQQKNELPALELIRACFQHIATDYELIQRATTQRRWNKANGAYYQSSQALELVVMDTLALKAVAPFQHLLTKRADQLAVITYFSEETHIHHLPYTDQCILVGVNYDRISPNDMLPAAATPAPGGQALTEAHFASFELMAIPHEVGHYIYQHGTVGGQTFPEISAQFKNNPYYRWCEELFADVYGCMIAGPLCVFSMQAFLTSSGKQRAWNDDDAHPTPRLRPFILSEILRVLGSLKTDAGAPALDAAWAERYAFSAVADQLDADWAGTLERWGYERVDAGTGRPARMYLPDDASRQLERIVNVNRLLGSVREIITAFAQLLHDALAQATAGAGGPPDSAEIPWKSTDRQGRTERERYAREMALLTQTTTAGHAAALAVLRDAGMGAPSAADLAKPADERLLAYMRSWGDSGPMGSGRGTY